MLIILDTLHRFKERTGSFFSELLERGQELSHLKILVMNLPENLNEKNDVIEKMFEGVYYTVSDISYRSIGMFADLQGNTSLVTEVVFSLEEITAHRLEELAKQRWESKYF